MHSLSFSLVARWHRWREWSYTPSVVNGNSLFSHLNTDYNIIYHNPLILSSTFLLLLWLLPTQAVQAFSWCPGSLPLCLKMNPDTHFICLYQWSHSFSHYQKLMSKGESWLFRLHSVHNSTKCSHAPLYPHSWTRSRDTWPPSLGAATHSQPEGSNPLIYMSAIPSDL